ncbi:MAG: DNA mismatch repair endonuclease MutL [Alphaproteobacteria bacterium]
MTIRLLPSSLVNRIAAGEVIDRPSGAIKELIENSIDAGATKIEVIIRDGGKNFIQVADNGCGMGKDDLELSVQRHATSKLPDDDLFFISTMGFRGEALASIGSVSRMNITTRKQDDDNAWEINVDGGDVSPIKPTSGEVGTTIVIKDLFYAVPARLKFLKTDRAEAMAILDIVKRISLSHAGVEFIFNSDGKEKLHLKSHTGDDARLLRIGDVLGKDFIENNMYIESVKDDVKVFGFASIPTLNTNTNANQFMFVNGRAIRDKQILGAIRAGFMDVVPSGRHPMVVLFINTNPRFTDVNVHPTKSEVRFMDAPLVRGMIVSSIRRAIDKNGFATSSTIADSAVDMLAKSVQSNVENSQMNFANTGNLNESQVQSSIDYIEKSFAPLSKIDEVDDTEINFNEFPLGSAKTQLHKNYIISQNADGIVIVDAHAAHERITYEKLKLYHKENIATQILLLPEVIELSEEKVSALMEFNDNLKQLGLVFDSFDEDAINVRETPALLGEVDVKSLLNDIAGEILEMDNTTTLEKKLDYICATIACHSSVRTGRSLNTAEMNDLLRQMEKTPSAGQCNHGRPTYLKLSLSDIEKLFER